MRRFRITARARTDADRIFHWLNRRSIRGSVAWFMAFQQCLAQVHAAPESHGAAPESAALNVELRQAFFKTRHGRRYRLIFSADASDIVILRVRGPGQAALRRRDLPE